LCHERGKRRSGAAGVWRKVDVVGGWEERC
jgi:hypothetical protein